MNHKAFAILRSFSVIALISIILLLPETGRGDELDHTASPQATVQNIITKRDASGLEFDLIIPRAVIDHSGSVTVPGLDLIPAEAGAPALPYFSTLIAIPPHASYDIEVTEIASEQFTSAAVQPVPTRHLRLREGVNIGDATIIDRAGALFEPPPSIISDPLIYEADAYYPNRPYTLDVEGVAGDLRLVKLNLFPLRYNPVREILHQSRHLSVRVMFHGAMVRGAVAENDTLRSRDYLRESVINYPEADWRVQPGSEQESAANVPLPVGDSICKIEVDHDAIYAIKGRELDCLGRDLADINPNLLRLVHRGKDVAYQFANLDAQAGFGPTDEIRFFGWEFEGSRYEDMYISSNVFWLWANSNGSKVTTVNNEPGKYPVRPYFEESITKWPHKEQFSGWEVQWLENEGTLWHWQKVTIPKGTSVAVDLPIDLPDPAVNSGQPAKILVEFTSRFTSLGNSHTVYAAEVALNGNATPAVIGKWENAGNTNVENGQIPISQLLTPGEGSYPENQVNVKLSTASEDKNSNAYITRVTATYSRNFVAIDDQLIFSRKQAGGSEYQISGFSAGAIAEPVVWDISDQYNPVVIRMNTSQATRMASEATMVIGRAHGANARFIATSENNVEQLKDIPEYIADDLDPPGKGAAWVAISHPSLLPAADDLANYRAGKSGISTWAVDAEEIVNQYGYGFNTPQPYQEFLKEAMATWAEPPQYVTLFGDTTTDPRHFLCEPDCDADDALNSPNLLPTDLLFIDRFNGLVPVDYTFSLLVGDDIYPDVATGRIPAETLAEANGIVAKIKTFEKNLVPPRSWLKNVLFVNDNSDGGGNFCQESKTTATRIPPTFDRDFLCLPDNSQEATDALRTELFNDYINKESMWIMNYRGHGSVSKWAGPPILSIDSEDTAAWQNVGRPLILISADCLDGYFAYPTSEGLGETYFGLGNERGSAAHWSSSGLGFTFEHSIMHNAFYDGIFRDHISGIGNLVNYAKIVYLTGNGHKSEAFSFTLLADPAMAASPASIQLPVVIRP